VQKDDDVSSLQHVSYYVAIISESNTHDTVAVHQQTEVFQARDCVKDLKAIQDT